MPKDIQSNQRPEQFEKTPQASSGQKKDTVQRQLNGLEPRKQDQVLSRDKETPTQHRTRINTQFLRSVENVIAFDNTRQKSSSPETPLTEFLGKHYNKAASQLQGSEHRLSESDLKKVYEPLHVDGQSLNNYQQEARIREFAKNWAERIQQKNLADLQQTSTEDYNNKVMRHLEVAGYGAAHGNPITVQEQEIEDLTYNVKNALPPAKDWVIQDGLLRPKEPPSETADGSFAKYGSRQDP